MRNITVFTVLVIIVCGAQIVSAQEKPHKSPVLSLGYQFGFLYGQAEEIVYPSSEYKAELLSQLLWDMKPVLYNGLTLDFAPAPAESGFIASLSLKYGIPGGSGKMEDRDWMSVENTALTNFSSHDNVTREFFSLDARAGYSFSLVRFLLLKPFINVSYMRFRFSGMDGYCIYARLLEGEDDKYYPINENPKKGSLSGRVINYTQEWFNAAPGVSLGLYFLDYFLAELSFQISALSFCSGLDEHLLRNIQFRDIMLGGLFLEPGAQFVFSPVEWISFSIECSWRYAQGTKGNSYSRTYGSGYYTQNSVAGAGLSILDTGLRLKVRL